VVGNDFSFKLTFCLYSSSSLLFVSNLVSTSYKLILRGGEDKQCMCNATLRRICATIVAVESQKVLHSLSVYL